MTRRIVLAVLALIAAVLGSVALPLGILTAGQDQRAFTDETVATTTTLANVAEERLDDGTGERALVRLVSRLASEGMKVSVYDRTGRRIAGTTPPPAVPPARLATARKATVPAVYPLDDAVQVVAPVRNDDDTANVGTVALVRPSAQVDHQVAVLWGLIALVSTAGLLTAALVAIGLARWVSSPLGHLEDAAQLLGDGDLRTRAPADTGPSEVRRLAHNFNLMAARLEALVHSHQATMADVSHQLRTPLAALRLRLELLGQDSDEFVAAEVAGAQDEIRRLSRLVNGLLAVARAENLTTAPVLVAVDAVIGNRVAAWRPAADEQGITLSTGPLEHVYARLGDGQLEQVLDNLLANALDALEPGGSITLSVRLAGDRVMIAVADNGPGMSDEQKRTAFRRFATNSPDGTGLGLAIVDRLAVSSGGSAALSDTPGGGLTVTIELPAAKPDRGSRRSASTSRPSSQGRSDGQGRPPDQPTIT
jgi:signal transduction histidine kinase